MWFTRLSIGNPVMAVMVMLAFVVLGLFSYQRLKVDQFPEIDFPTVVVQTDYPGAAPEVVESEVTRKIEEAVNTIAGINQLFSRSYESSSVVIVQFNLDVNGRRAADEGGGDGDQHRDLQAGQRRGQVGVGGEHALVPAQAEALGREGDELALGERHADHHHQRRQQEQHGQRHQQGGRHTQPGGDDLNHGVAC